MKKLSFWKSALCVAAISFAGVGATAAEYTLTAFDQLQNGDVVVIADTQAKYALPNNGGSSTAPAAVDITLSADKSQITSEVAPSLRFEVELADGGVRFKVPETSNYLYCTNSNNGVRVGTNENNVFALYAASEASADYNGPWLKNVATNRYVGVYNGTDWRCYTTDPVGGNNISSTATAFYKESGDPVVAETKHFESLSELLSSDIIPSKGESEEFILDCELLVMYSNGAYNYVTDTEACALIYGSELGIKADDVLAGGWKAKVKNFNGLLEIIPSEALEVEGQMTLADADLNIPVDFDDEMLADLWTAESQNWWVRLYDVEVLEATPATATAYNVKIGDNEYTFYNRFNLEPVEPGKYTVEGFMSVFNTTVQLYPTSFTKVASEDPDPEIGPVTVPTLTLDWEVKSNLSAANARFATSDKTTGQVLVAEKGENKIYAFAKDGSYVLYDMSETEIAGKDQSTAIGCDEAGNIIVNTTWPNAGSATDWYLIPRSNGLAGMTPLHFEFSDPARCDYIGRVIGDMMSEEGGMAFVPFNTKKAFGAALICNGEVSESMESVETPGAVNNMSPVVPMMTTVAEQLATGEITGDWASPAWVYTHNAPIYYWDFEAEDFASRARLGVDGGSVVNTYGFDVFELGGKKYIIQGSGSAHWAIGFIIYDLEGNQVASWQSDVVGASGNYSTINVWPREDGYTADVYMYTCGNAARHFVFQVPAPDVCAAPVFNPEGGEVEAGTVVTISSATEGAVISYSINGADAIEAASPVSVTINDITIIKAIAKAEGKTPSQEVEAYYTIKAAPVVDNNTFYAAGLTGIEGVALVNSDGGTTGAQNDATKTIEGITFKGANVEIKFTDAEDGNTNYTASYGDHVRWYQGDNLTITAFAEYKIEKVEFIVAKNSKGAFTAPVGTVEGNGTTENSTITWTAPANEEITEITFNAAKQVRFSEFTVTCGPTSGVEGVSVDNNSAVEYYNLQGMKIQNPVSGQIVIRRQGNNVSKVIVK